MKKNNFINDLNLKDSKLNANNVQSRKLVKIPTGLLVLSAICLCTYYALKKYRLAEEASNNKKI